jgi:hypothetical protein
MPLRHFRFRCHADAAADAAIFAMLSVAFIAVRRAHADARMARWRIRALCARAPRQRCAQRESRGTRAAARSATRSGVYTR